MIELLVLRHAKSDWGTGLRDFDRTPERAGQPMAVVDPPGPLTEAPERGIVLLDAGDRVATGFIVSEEGHIVTAAHLLAGPTEKLTAHYFNGKQQECKVVCYRRDYNLGMVKTVDRPRAQLLPLTAREDVGRLARVDALGVNVDGYSRVFIR